MSTLMECSGSGGNYNDKYGFRQGDRAILIFSDIMKMTATVNSFFTGHIGGDDFFAGFNNPNSEILRINNLIKNIIVKFASDVVSLYNPEDREKGYIISTDREGNVKQFPFLTVSASVITVPAKKINITVEELSQIIADLKKSAKTSETRMASIVLGHKGNV